MTVWDLSRLRYTVRKLSGQFDTNQLPDASPAAGSVTINSPPSVDDYINDFYLFDLPEHMRTLRLKQYFTFTTLPNVGTYNVPQTIYQLEPPLYVDNYQFNWYQSPDQFFRVWPELQFIDLNLFTPNGTQTTFNFTLSQTPVQQGTVVIGLQPNVDGASPTQMETFTDVDTPGLLDQPLNMKFTNPGVLTGNLGSSGSVDYLSGAVSITYLAAPPNGTNGNAHYHPYVASRPRDVMFFQQQLFVRPIPNDTYLVKMLCYMQPTVLLGNLTNSGAFYPPPSQTPGVPSQFDGGSGSGIIGSAAMKTVPQFNEWWQLIAYGAALKILAQEADWEEYGRLEQVFEKQKLLAQRKEIRQLANQRIQTPYAENSYGQPTWPIFPMY